MEAMGEDNQIRRRLPVDAGEALEEVEAEDSIDAKPVDRSTDHDVDRRQILLADTDMTEQQPSAAPRMRIACQKIACRRGRDGGAAGEEIWEHVPHDVLANGETNDAPRGPRLSPEHGFQVERNLARITRHD